MKPVIFMISGQGSQYYQMGLDLYSENKYFYETIHSFDDVVKERFGISIIDVIYNNRKHMSEVFDDPVLSSLGIYLIEYALVSTLAYYGVNPTRIIGSSMGMFVSSVLARCIDKYQGLEAIFHLMSLVKKRCEKGCMIVVFADSKQYHNSELLKKKSVLAAVDEKLSFIVSLPEENLNCVELYLNKTGEIFHRLPVSRAYHSHWMDNVRDDFLGVSLGFSSVEASVSLTCCAKTDEVESVGLFELWYAVREPLLFSDTIYKIEKKMTSRYVDVGPSGTMATCLKHILPKDSKSEIYTILSPYKQASNNFEQVVKDCANIEA